MRFCDDSPHAIEFGRRSLSFRMRIQEFSIYVRFLMLLVWIYFAALRYQKSGRSSGCDDMTELRTTSARTCTTGTTLQVLLGLALAADLVFLGMVGIRLSDRVEQTGVALAGGLTLLLVGVLLRLTRRIGSGAPAVEPG
jgi:hypothetical protein